MQLLFLVPTIIHIFTLDFGGFSVSALTTSTKWTCIYSWLEDNLCVEFIIAISYIQLSVSNGLISTSSGRLGKLEKSTPALFLFVKYSRLTIQAFNTKSD